MGLNDDPLDVDTSVLGSQLNEPLLAGSSTFVQEEKKANMSVVVEENEESKVQDTTATGVVNVPKMPKEDGLVPNRTNKSIDFNE